MKFFILLRMAASVGWPNGTDLRNKSAPFRIAYFGDNDFLKEYLEKEYSKYAIARKRVKFYFTEKLEDIGNFHVLFIPKVSSRTLNRILKYVENKPIFTVTDVNDYIEQGVHVYLTARDQRIKQGGQTRTRKTIVFEINETAVRTSGLAIPDSFLRLAKKNVAPFGDFKKQVEMVEQLSRFIDWPQSTGIDNTSTPFVISVIGSPDFVKELQNYYRNKRIKKKPVLVKSISQPREIASPHMLYIDTSAKKRLREILFYTRKKPILTIGDTEGFGKYGVHVNFFYDRLKLKFEINNLRAREASLVISDQLLSTAKLINHR